MAVAASSASADSAEVISVTDISYTSALVKGKVTVSPGFTGYKFEYSTDGNVWNETSIEFSGALNEKEVEGPLTGLKGGTEYFVRIATTTGAISPEPNPSFTTLTVEPPTIPGVVEASPVFSTSATAIATVKRPANENAAFDVNCHFEYITDALYEENVTNIGPGTGFTGATPAPCDQNPVDKADLDAEPETKVTAPLLGLGPNTTYHLRLITENAAPGVVTKDAANFTTSTKVTAPTVTATDDASEVKFNSAKLTGKVLRPAGVDPALDVNCHFEYITDAAFKATADEHQTLYVFATAGTYTLSFGGQITPAIAFDATAAEVETQLNALSSIGGVGGSIAVSGGPGDESGTSPYAFTFGGSLSETDVEQLSVDPTNLSSQFAYVETSLEGRAPGFSGAQPIDCEQNSITAAKVDAGGELGVSAEPGLVATTKYHFRLVAENQGGTDVLAAANTFTTPEAELPTVTIDPVEGGTFTTAHVSGTISANVPDRFVRPFIEKSIDNSNWEFFEAPSGNPGVTKHDYSGLSPSTTYFFRICATYSSSEHDQALANGEMACSPEPNPSITTEPLQVPPTAENLAATDVTATTAHFSGTVNPNALAGPLSPAAKKAYATKWHFECTPECKDANENVIGGTVQGEEGAQAVTGDVKRLEPDKEYTVSLIVSSEGGTDTEEKIFPTDKSPPAVKQTPGAPDGTGGYTLQGVVNPNNETITACKFKWGPDAPAYAFSADCSPMPTPGAKPTTVEAHLTNLNPDVDYHALLVVTYGAGSEAKGVDQTFKATLASNEPCPDNEQQRIENNSLALPECRAYEMVTPPGKEGFGAKFETYDGGDRVAYESEAGNIAKSGQGANNGNRYVAARTKDGWQTIPNLNGSSGSLRDAPSYVDSNIFSTGLMAYSPDLRSSIWKLHRKVDPGSAALVTYPYLRSPDGTFTPLGSPLQVKYASPGSFDQAISADLSHFVSPIAPSNWGPGIYEYVGTGMDQPRRVDLDNAGAPISTCTNGPFSRTAVTRFVSSDGSRIVNDVYGGCGGANPPADELWARVNDTTAVDVSASNCDRSAADPGGVCNGPVGDGGCTYNSNGLEVGAGCRALRFQGSTPDGSRVFFTTKQQLVNADTDQTNDLYACDIPAGNPAPTAEKANSCAAFRQVSAGDSSGADVEGVNAISEDGSTVLFTAKGKLAGNEDALGEEAAAGDHNLYAWRIDASHPDGQTTFVARLEANDVGGAQTTPDGHYLVFTTAGQLLDTDTDSGPRRLPLRRRDRRTDPGLDQHLRGCRQRAFDGFDADRTYASPFRRRPEDRLRHHRGALTRPMAMPNPTSISGPPPASPSSPPAPPAPPPDKHRTTQY